MPPTTRIIYQPYGKGLRPGTPVVCRDAAEGERRAEKAMAAGSILGARRVMLGALGLFTLASIGCALANGFWPFVLWRVVQGAGGAVMVPVGQAVVLRASDRSRMIQAIGLVTWPALIAPVLGQALGGFITTFFSWRWNFWLNVPVGLALAGFILWALPEYRAAQPGRWRCGICAGIRRRC
jgi:MFS family permease